MATSVPVFQTSLVPIFLTRLRLLEAILPSLRSDLPPSRITELQSLLERAARLTEEATGQPTSSEAEFVPKM